MVDTLVFSFHDVTIFLTIAEGLLLSIFWKMADKDKPFINYLLQLYLCCIALNALTNLMVWNPAIKPLVAPYATPIALIAGFASLTKGPLLYLYFSAHVNNWFRMPNIQWLHFLLPFFVILSFLAIDMDSIRLTKSIAADEPDWGVFYSWSVMRLIPFLYALACVSYLFRSKRLAEHYYDSTNQAHIRWFQLLIIGYLIHWGWAYGVHVLGQKIPPSLAHHLGNIEDYSAFLLVNLLLLYSFKYSKELHSIQRKLDCEAGLANRNDTNLKKASPLIINKIDNAIHTNKIYLQKNMTVERFADTINQPCREVSNAINQYYQCNFLEFINQYRIEEAKRLLSLPEHKSTAIGEIISLSGFNSKSAFHRFFKRFVGSTPTEYRKQIKYKPENLESEISVTH